MFGEFLLPKLLLTFYFPIDVIQWTEACVEAHGALIALSSIKEMEKSTELYKTIKVNFFTFWIHFVKYAVGELCLAISTFHMIQILVKS